MKFRKDAHFGYTTYDPRVGRMVGVRPYNTWRARSYDKWIARGLGSDKRVGYGSTRAAAVQDMGSPTTEQV